MTTFKKTLLDYFPAAAHMGGEDDAIDLEALRNTLAGLTATIKTRYWVAVAMIAATFIAGLVILFIYLDEPAHIVALFSAMGVTVSVAIRRILTLSKEAAFIDLTVALSLKVKPEDLPPVIHAIIAKL